MGSWGTGWPVEQPAPKKIKSGKVTVLFIYGNLFYAAADAFEKNLPAVENANKAAVILLLLGYEDVGRTVNAVLRRYAHALQANQGKLILAGVSIALRAQFQRTGLVDLIGKENIFLATKTIGESGNTALSAASDWIAENTTKDDSNGEIIDT
jgi:sulfate permease, SulP family